MCLVILSCIIALYSLWLYMYITPSCTVCMCLLKLLWQVAIYSHRLHWKLTSLCIDYMWVLRLPSIVDLYLHRLHPYLSPSCIGFVWCCSQCLLLYSASQALQTNTAFPCSEPSVWTSSSDIDGTRSLAARITLCAKDTIKSSYC